MARRRVRYTLILNDDSKQHWEAPGRFTALVWQRFNDHPSDGFRYLRVSFLCHFTKRVAFIPVKKVLYEPNGI
jgi:hypothetical protein